MKTFFLSLFLVMISASAMAETAFERITKTGKIKCGYGISDPWLYFDFQENKVKGIAVDISEAMADRLSLELVWGEETGWANLPTSLYTGRVDLACSTLWNDPSKASQVAYTQPVYYNALYPYVREDDTRFNSLEDLNSSEAIIAVQDGGFSVDVTNRLFKNAKRHEIPQFAPWTDLFQNVADGKADMLIADDLSVQNFNKNNKKKLKRVPVSEPTAVYGTAYAVSIKEPELHRMIENVVQYMIQSGEIERLTRDFREKYPDVILLPEMPYQTSR